MQRGNSQDKSMAALFIFYEQFIAPARMQQKSFTLRKKLCIVYLLLGYVALELLDSLIANPSRTFSSFISPSLLHFPIAPVMKNTKEPCGLWC